MFHLLSFSGRWAPAFFASEPTPQQAEERTEAKKQATHAAVMARAQVRLARKDANLQAKWDEKKNNKKRLSPDQLNLVLQLKNGTLEEEAKRLTLLSGHGTFKSKDGTFIQIGGSTGGFTRAVLYDWTPPILDDEHQ